MLQMNKALLPLVEEDSNFYDATPSLYYLGRSSPGNLKIIIKAMRSVAGSSRDLKLSFFNLAPQQPGGYNRKPGRGGGQNFQRAQNTQGRGVSMDQMYVCVCL